MKSGIEGKFAISIPEAAKASGLSRSYLYKLSAEGKLPILKVGTRCLVPVDSFKQWLLEHARKEKQNLSIS